MQTSSVLPELAGVHLGENEAVWRAAHDVSETILALLRERLTELAAYDQRVRAARGARSAAEQSLQLTLRCAQRCGLASSPVTLQNVRRLRQAIDRCRAEVYLIIGEATPSCAIVEELCLSLREARARERSVLENLLKRLPATPAPSQCRESAEAVGRAKVKRRLEFLEQVEREEQSRERSLPDDAHYDPGYSDWEILMRRNRPWL